MDSKTIQKYQKKSVPQLLKLATRHFNEFVRLRDSKDGIGLCISSGKILRVPCPNSHAGHYFSAGSYSALRFDEDNVHLQGKSDNYFKSGNLLEYRNNLIKKIGIERVEKLEIRAQFSKRHSFKWNRFELIDIIEKYKEKVKVISK